MRILYYSPHPELPLDLDAGPGVHMREVIRAMRELGHEVKTLIMGGDKRPVPNPLDERLEGGEVKDTFKKLTPAMLWQTAKDYKLIREDDKGYEYLRQAAIDWKPDLIYERGYYMMTSGVRVANELHIRHVLEMNAPYPEERISMEGKSAYHKRSLHAECRQFNDTDRIVVVSSALKEYVTKQVQGAAGKTVITPNAIRPEQFIRNPNRRAHVRAARGFSDSHIVVGFVGSIFPYHGVDLLLKAIAQLVPEFPQLRALIVGNGLILNDLKNLARDLKISDRVVWTGAVTGQFIPDHIAAMDIAVMARSNWYGSPVKIFEYGALGKAVIAPDVLPVKDVMEHGKDGLLVKPGTDDLAAALKKLTEDQTLRTSLGQHWQQKVIQHHTWSQVVLTALADL